MSYPYFVKYYQSYVFLFKYDSILCLRKWGVSFWGIFSKVFFPEGIFLGFFLGWYFFRGFISGGYNRGNKLMVHLLEYRPLSPSFNVGLGLLVMEAKSKLNPLNIEVRGKGGG